MGIKLGDKVKDSITDFEGVVIARIEYLNGCIRYSVQPTKLNEKGEIAETAWIDEQQLVKKSKVKTGGPGVVPTVESYPR